ncbi:MAG: hypothetical protein MZV64_44310 [Ignavibacteriales bacterium]|nr:hypothetical protein [Ignavibacteriales bacterium]
MRLGGEPPLDPHGERGGRGAAYRVRQRRQPLPGARRGADGREMAVQVTRHGRRRRTHRLGAPEGSPGARPSRRGSGPRAGLGRPARAGDDRPGPSAAG